jgi:serine/threonine protein kinase
MSAASATLPFPSRLGRFELLTRLGVGGMATVFLARARGPHGFERHVAIKLMHPHLRLDPVWAKQFVIEARIAARIVHPNVVGVTDVAEDADGVYLVLDYVEGDTLSGLVKESRARGGTVPLPIAMRILSDALAGLHAAHELRDPDGQAVGLVHRDFSPQNVLVGVDGLTRLTDFGIAKTTMGERTTTGLVKGKLAYMSPEQASGQPLDRRSDVWAAGVMAWELVTGERMHPGAADEMATLMRIVSTRPRRASSRRPEVSRALDEAIAAALEPKRESRLASADALREALAEAVDLADPSEVAQYVRRVAAPRIDALRDQMSASRTLREAEAVTPLAPENAAVTAISMATPPRARRQISRSALWRRAFAGVGAALVVGGAVFAWRESTRRQLPVTQAAPQSVPATPSTSPTTSTTSDAPSSVASVAPASSRPSSLPPTPSAGRGTPAAKTRAPARSAPRAAPPAPSAPPPTKRLLPDPLDDGH